MRRYELSVNNTPYEIDIEEISATQFEVHLNNKVIKVALTSQADAADAVISPKLEVGARGVDDGTSEAPKVPEAMRAATPRTPSPVLPGGTGAAHSMTAPMPGVILEINVAVGDQVATGDVVMILEAMKMKNELHASRDGVIESLDVSAGDQVKYGQTLLRFAKD